ncbi:MAG: hypothetical protein N5P05_003368 [Chroococcopsis gigantea SAG 12.99]|jgi:hypothetical protein|nr:hypothetical protein [Chlorogloea purpurea SAG 13.99]MDV3001762.1 hypothetical protein [Chroococcopsis gigantea SAG 12.99]
MALVSTFELLLKSQLPKLGSAADNLSRNILQGYFLTIANVNFFEVTVSIVITFKFPIDPVNPTAQPQTLKDLLDAVDISGQNIISVNSLTPEVAPNKARLTFTLPSNSTGLLLIQPNILDEVLLNALNFEARGYVEVFLSSLSGSDTATLLLTPEHRGTFFKDINGKNLDERGLDQIAYALPVSNGGVFRLSNA